ncbi:MAG: hypothetical protein M1573_02465, partial [Candidatus Parvarchaeota archaeon]|nr:hypothetical protein [Candidatus Parvarchaeota archaeon]
LIYSFFFADKKSFSPLVDVLFIAAVLGATLVVLSSNLLAVILSIELLSLSSYSLVYFGKTLGTLEGAMKYISTSMVSFVILLFGASLVYAGAGTLSFSNLSSVNYIPFVAGLAVIIAGLGFKSTLVPFHMWAPDTYEASDSTITAFITSVAKAAGIVAMIRIFFFGFQVSSSFVTAVFLALALFTIFLAGIFAIAQDRIKRILAFSSISQAGFAFLGIALLNLQAVSSAVFYIFSFAVADALLFLSFRIMEEKGIRYKKDIKRMFSVSKIATIGFFLGVLSLFGFPPTIGFVGKLLILASLLSHGYIYIVGAVFLMLLLSVFYYFGLFLSLDFKAYSQNKMKKINSREIIILIFCVSLFAGIAFATI